MAKDLTALTITEALAGMKAGEFTSEQITQALLDRIAERNPKLNAYLEVYEDALE